MRRYFLIFTETLAMSTFPLLFGLAVVAPEAVVLLLHSKWASAAAPLSWLAMFMAVRTLSYPATQLLATLRFARFGAWVSFLSLAIMPVAFWFASGWGVGAVAASWLVLAPVTVLPTMVKVCREIECGTAEYLGALLPASVGCGAMLAVILTMPSWLTLSGWPRLISEVALGGTVYCTVLWFLFRERVMRFVRFFLDLRKPRDAAAV
jgi:O-antigen/teichoic acid export membrane protein